VKQKDMTEYKIEDSSLGEKDNSKKAPIGYCQQELSFLRI